MPYISKIPKKVGLSNILTRVYLTLALTTERPESWVNKMCHNTSATFTNQKHNNFSTKIRTVLPAIKSTTSVCVDCVTCVPSTFTITSFSRIPARSAAPPDRTVWTETGLSPDKVKPNPDCSSRLTISVRVLSVVVVEGEAALGLLAPLKLEWKGIWKIPGNIPAVTEWSHLIVPER